MAHDGTRPRPVRRLVSAVRRWYAKRSKRSQGMLLAVSGVAALLVMLTIANPFAQDTDDTNSASPSPSLSSGTRSSSATPDGSPTADEGADGQDTVTGDDMWDLSVEELALKVREILNSPAESNVDTLSNLLVRHGREELASASNVFEAIGQETPAAALQEVASRWYRDVLDAGAQARREDITSGLDGADQAVRQLASLGLDERDGCADLAGASQSARLAVSDPDAGYEELTGRAEAMNAALSVCASSLSADDLARVFGQPQGSVKP